MVLRERARGRGHERRGRARGGRRGGRARGLGEIARGPAEGGSRARRHVRGRERRRARIRRGRRIHRACPFLFSASNEVASSARGPIARARSKTGRPRSSGRERAGAANRSSPPAHRTPRRVTGAARDPTGFKSDRARGGGRGASEERGLACHSARFAPSRSTTTISALSPIPLGSAGSSVAARRRVAPRGMMAVALALARSGPSRRAPPACALAATRRVARHAASASGGGSAVGRRARAPRFAGGGAAALPPARARRRTRRAPPPRTRSPPPRARAPGPRPPTLPAPGVVHLWLVDPHGPASDPSTLAFYERRCLAPEEAAALRDGAPMTDAARRQAIQSKALTRCVLARYCGEDVAPASLRFAYGEHGKPALVAVESDHSDRASSSSEEEDLRRRVVVPRAAASDSVQRLALREPPRARGDHRPARLARVETTKIPRGRGGSVRGVARGGRRLRGRDPAHERELRSARVAMALRRGGE